MTDLDERQIASVYDAYSSAERLHNDLPLLYPPGYIGSVTVSTSQQKLDASVLMRELTAAATEAITSLEATEKNDTR